MNSNWKLVFLDLEAKRPPEEVGGWNIIAKMGLAAAATYSTPSGELRIFAESDAMELVTTLNRADCVIGHNCHRFHFTILRGLAGRRCPSNWRWLAGMVLRFTIPTAVIGSRDWTANSPGWRWCVSSMLQCSIWLRPCARCWTGPGSHDSSQTLPRGVAAGLVIIPSQPSRNSFGAGPCRRWGGFNEPSSILSPVAQGQRFYPAPCDRHRRGRLVP